MHQNDYLWSKGLTNNKPTKFVTHLKIEICQVNRVGKHDGKRRKCWLPAVSSFPTIFSKVFPLRRPMKTVPNRHCIVSPDSTVTRTITTNT